MAAGTARPTVLVASTVRRDTSLVNQPVWACLSILLHSGEENRSERASEPCLGRAQHHAGMGRLTVGGTRIPSDAGPSELRLPGWTLMLLSCIQSDGSRVLSCRSRATYAFSGRKLRAKRPNGPDRTVSFSQDNRPAEPGLVQVKTNRRGAFEWRSRLASVVHERPAIIRPDVACLRRSDAETDLIRAFAAVIRDLGSLVFS
jgi:hypothetical protein